MSNKVILYSSSECDRCKMVKKMLDFNNVSYDEVTDKQMMINLGFEQVPVLEVDGKIIENFTSILVWLEDKGYYSENALYKGGDNI